MFNTKPHEDAVAWMSGDFGHEAILHNATVTERLGTITRMRLRFEVRRRVPPTDFVGKAMRVHVELREGTGRSFSGICTSVETRIDGPLTLVEAEVRPWLWMLTRNRNTRIFQERTVDEIITDVLSEAGFSDYELRLNSTYEQRIYCVQYRESDFDFLSRLMQQEGIYYFIPSPLNELDPVKLIICDDIGGHSAVPEYSTIDYCLSDNVQSASDDQIFDWSLGMTVLAGKVTLDDYDPFRPGADLTTVNIQRSGSHPYAGYEIYDHPGGQTFYGMSGIGSDERGNHLARIRMEAEAAKYETWNGRTGVRTMGVGRTFTLANFPVAGANKEYLVTAAKHEIEADYGRQFQKLKKDRAVYTCNFSAIPVTVPYRSEPRTPWPSVAGLQTATVVGPSGEEIYTDENGRIRVQFHWDRIGQKNESSSCWVRVMTPMSGKNWGMIHIPRIGQEVVIQFEEGDPDRPICTGMLYNAETMPPYPLPDNKTQSGIRTDSSKDVSDTTHYNELMFEDKAGEELVRMQAQKHHEMLVKNKSSLTIGFDEMDFGDHDGDFSLSTVIKQNVSEKITDGDKFLKIETGSETIEIKTDKTQTIEGNRTDTVTGNHETTILDGNVTTTLNSGDMTTTLDSGNYDVSLALGDASLTADLGKITNEAAQSIELKVGANSIKIDQSGVTIKGTLVKIEGKAMTEVKAPMTQVKGDTLLILKGGITMIN